MTIYIYILHWKWGPVILILRKALLFASREVSNIELVYVYLNFPLNKSEEMFLWL